jgi:hypothetical protein
MIEPDRLIYWYYCNLEKILKLKNLITVCFKLIFIAPTGKNYWRDSSVWLDINYDGYQFGNLVEYRIIYSDDFNSDFNLRKDPKTFTNIKLMILYEWFIRHLLIDMVSPIRQYIFSNFFVGDHSSILLLRMCTGLNASLAGPWLIIPTASGITRPS